MAEATCLEKAFKAVKDINSVKATSVGNFISLFCVLLLYYLKNKVTFKITFLLKFNNN